MFVKDGVSQDRVVEALNREYDADDGFVGRLRFLAPDFDAADRFLSALSCTRIDDIGGVDRRLAVHLYYVPLLACLNRGKLEAMVERGLLSAEDYRRLDDFIARYAEVCETILGVSPQL